MPGPDLGELRGRRIAQQVEAGRVAAALGVSVTTLQSLEHGTRVASFENVHDYAAAPGIQIVLRPAPIRDASP